MDIEYVEEKFGKIESMLDNLDFDVDHLGKESDNMIVVGQMRNLLFLLVNQEGESELGKEFKEIHHVTEQLRPLKKEYRGYNVSKGQELRGLFYDVKGKLEEFSK